MSNLGRPDSDEATAQRLTTLADRLLIAIAVQQIVERQLGSYHHSQLITRRTAEPLLQVMDVDRMRRVDDLSWMRPAEPLLQVMDVDMMRRVDDLSWVRPAEPLLQVMDVDRMRRVDDLS